MAYIICEPCVGTKDKACVGACPVDCIYEADGCTGEPPSNAPRKKGSSCRPECVMPSAKSTTGAAPGEGMQLLRLVA